MCSAKRTLERVGPRESDTVARAPIILTRMKYGPYVPHEFGLDAEAHYRTALGWLTAACSASIPWPEDDVRVHYDGDDYFLRGVRERNGHRSGPAITMRCKAGQGHEVVGKIYRFASILGWYKRGYVEVGGYITGTHAIHYSEPQSHASTIAGGPHGFDCNYLPLVRDERTRRALAFWREGARLRHIHIGYAFLSFFKVIESQFDKSPARVAWIAASLPTLAGNAAKRVTQLNSEVSDVGRHIYESGRSAVAHAQYSDGRGDPDVPEDRKRLASDLDVIEALARKYITEDLRVPDEMEVYRTRNRFEPLEPYVSAEVQQALKSRTHVSRRRIGLDGITVGLAHWPRAPAGTFAKLGLRVTEVREGWVLVSGVNHVASVTVGFAFDFTSHRAHIDFKKLNYQLAGDYGNVDDAIAVIELRKQVIGNGRMELWLPDGSRVDFEVVIPVNIDVGGTCRSMDAQIAQLRQLQTKKQASGSDEGAA